MDCFLGNGNYVIIFLVDFQIKPTQLPTFPIEVFDFYNIPGRNFLHNKSTAENGSPKNSKIAETKHASAEMYDLWSAVIRTVSFFIIRSRYLSP